MNMQIDQEKLMKFAVGVVNDLGAMISGGLVLVGDKCGIYKALAEAGPSTPDKLAEFTGLDERYLLEWLRNQAACGYIDYNASDETFSMNFEQQMVFANEDSPVHLLGGFYGSVAAIAGEERLSEVFRSGEGVPWGDNHSCLFCGAAKLFKPAYTTHLVQEWIPGLAGIEDKLNAGGKVADVGCGHGISTMVMAKAFPNSTFIGFDFHGPSVDCANEQAKKEGLTNVSFKEASAKDFDGSDYDLVTFFDCLHDMGDPEGAAAHVKQALNPDGSLMVVEPMAGDSLSENMNPVGRLYYGFSTSVCVPASKSQEVGKALGAQAGEKALSEVMHNGGFSSVRRVAETPFNIVLEARL